MTARTPTYLKSRYENGDIPTGTDYEDVFDSYLNVATSSMQTVAGAVTFSNQIYASESNAALVSATSGIFSFVSAQTANIDFINSTRTSANAIYSASANITNLISSTVSAATLNAGTANIVNGNFNTASAASLIANAANFTTVTANDINVSGNVIFGSMDVSALATTQASTITLTATNNFVIFADGNNTSVKLPSSVRGREQRIINASTTVLKVFPATSGRFLVTAVNASLNLPADRVALVIHKGDDRYGFMVG